MDRNNVVGVVVLIMLLSFFVSRNYNGVNSKSKKTLVDDKKVENLQNVSVKEANNNQSLSSGNNLDDKKVVFDVENVRKRRLKDVQSEDIFLGNDELRVYFSTVGACFLRVVLKNYNNHIGKNVVLLDNSSVFNLSCDENLFNSANINFIVDYIDKNVIRFKSVDSENNIFVSYELDDKKPFEISTSVKVEGVNNVNLLFNENLLQQEKYLSDCRKNSYLNYFSNGSLRSLRSTANENSEKIVDCEWIAFKQKFFTTGVRFDKVVGGSVSIKNSNESVSNCSFSVKSGENNGSLSFKYFFGPNDYNVLSSFSSSFSKNMYLGFTLVSFFNKKFILPFVNYLNRNSCNVFIIIFLLVILLKTILLPINFKIYVITKKMQLLNKIMEVLKFKYSNDSQKLAVEQVLLYKEFNLNPLYLLLYNFIQFPFIISMYNFIPTYNIFRNRGFLWCDDLSSIDSVFDLGFNIPFYGRYVCVSAILMGIVMFFSMIVNSGVSEKKFKVSGFHAFFVVFIICISNGFCCALNVYYLFFNILTILTQILLNRCVKLTEFENLVEEKIRRIA